MQNWGGIRGQGGALVDVCEEGPVRDKRAPGEEQDRALRERGEHGGGGVL